MKKSAWLLAIPLACFDCVTPGAEAEHHDGAPFEDPGDARDLHADAAAPVTTPPPLPVDIDAASTTSGGRWEHLNATNPVRWRIAGLGARGFLPKALLGRIGKNKDLADVQRASVAAFEQIPKAVIDRHPFSVNRFSPETAITDLNAFTAVQYEPAPTRVSYEPGWMDFARKPGANEKIWFVNYANQSIGGGVLSHGNVQEETLVSYAPQILQFATSVYGPAHDRATHVNGRTRLALGKATLQLDASGAPVYFHEESPGRGYATPILFQNAWMAGQSAYQADPNSNHGTITRRMFSQPEAPFVNIISIAAPRQRQDGDSASQWSIVTLTDLYATAYSGFAAASILTPENETLMIVSGLLGAGVFYNHPVAVCAMQILAAEQVAVDKLILHTQTNNPTSDATVKRAQDLLAKAKHHLGKSHFTVSEVIAAVAAQ